jgi:SAM-dependent methyltransferase
MDILCPTCGQRSHLTKSLESCEGCGRSFRVTPHVLDLVDSPDRIEERAFYEDTYAAASIVRNPRQESIESVIPLWDLPQAPESRIVLNQVGDLSGKHVLLLGNGQSVKELAFLKADLAHLVYSDLSTKALINIHDRFDLSAHEHRVTFASIDAQAIPFSEHTFDLVYGYAVVHHLPDLPRFFDSVFRVLKPGGRAVFMDDAFAPVWHYSKQTWLKPLMKLSHRKTGISPEDYRFSMSGGFKEADLARLIVRAGGEPWFIRTSFLNYLFYRGLKNCFRTP